MTMKAVRVAQFGGEEKLKLITNVSIPKPTSDEVLIRMKASGINPLDTYIRQGIFDPNLNLPYTPGTDGAGVVEEVGEAVKNFKKGDRVLVAIGQSGTCAEYCTAKSMHVCHLLESVSFTQGASIGVPYYSAYRAIFTIGGTKPGDTVLVHGASGGVGVACVQMLKAHGCTVIGTAGTKEGLDLVLAQGADRVYNHREEGYMKTVAQEATDGINVIIEMLANANLKTDLEVIAPKGRIVVVGSRGPVEFDAYVAMLKECPILGVSMFAIEDDEWKEVHDYIIAGQRLGWLKPQVARVYSMEDAGKGHHDVTRNSRTLGKLVIDTSL